MSKDKIEEEIIIPNVGVNENIEEEKKQIIKILRTESLQALGIDKIVTFRDLYEQLSVQYNEIERINTIRIDNYSIESFYGMELFTNLASMNFNNCVISNLDDIIFIKDFGDSPIAPLFPHCLMF